MKNEKYQLGMIGLGVMGRNLALNMGDNGYSVVGFDKDTDKINQLNQEAGERSVAGASSLAEFIQQLETPRMVMMMVPAGPPVDAVIGELLDYLEAGDMVIDAGNSHFSDTEFRQETLAKKGIDFLGVGISGGEDGARHGPSIMPGGPRQAYQRVAPILEAISAHVEGEPCVTYLGPKGAGHYVKMVHNGIEYSLMQLIAESYDLMKRGLGLNDQTLHEVFQGWNRLELNSYLMEITANIFSEINPATGKPLIDIILDKAKQNGTGAWTSQNSMEIQMPVPSIDTAVAMRNLSALKEEREHASKALTITTPAFDGQSNEFVDTLRTALYAGMILTFSQGFALLRAASQTYDYRLDLAAIARIWRGGCIIRASLLNEIYTAFERQPDLTNLLLDPDLGADVIRLRESLAKVICAAVRLGIPVPGFSASLAYLDEYRSAWVPANLIQAQRDYFGAHTYERIDQKGTFHTEWTFKK